MQRRKFIKETGLVAVAAGFFGTVSWSNDKFIADTPTTTDVLGPFYRPGAPIRININPPGYDGQLFHIHGTIFKEDGKTPFKNARIEIWQCDENKVYDNLSDEFRYRGTQLTEADGKYHFICMHPIPYPADGNTGQMRPAHIHLLVSGEGQQDLITQVYLEGDPHLAADPAASSPHAVKRISKITQGNYEEEMVQFDIIMAKEWVPDNRIFEKLTGIYKMNDKTIVEFFRENDLLMFKWNGQIREGLSYKGNNTFTGGLNNSNTVRFQPEENNIVKVNIHFKPLISEAVDMEGVKIFQNK